MSRTSKRIFRIVDFILLFVMIASNPMTVLAATWTDPTDYPPGATVTIRGDNSSGFQYTEGALILVKAYGPPVAEPLVAWYDECTATVGAGGAWACDVHLSSDPAISVGAYTYDVFQGDAFAESGGFTDANPAADIDQCANDPSPSPSSDGCNSSATQWENGNLGASKSVYFEGDSIPYRIKFSNLSTTSSHTVTIAWDTTKGGKHAIDYLTTYNQSVLNANPCLGVAGCSAFTTFPIPADPQVTGGGVTPIAGVFTMFGGTITAVSDYSYPDGTGFSGDKSAGITITFTANVANPVLAWGGHISTRKDWGFDNSAVTISGSPYHSRLLDLDGSGGNQDRSLSNDAVVFPGSITIVKDAIPDGATAFEFAASPSPLGNFSLTDDGTTANTKVFSNISNFTTYNVAETVPANWSVQIACSVTSPNGGSQTVTPPAVAINLKEGENVSCKFTNVLQTGTLTLVKVVDNLGETGAGYKGISDFPLTIDGASATSGTPVTVTVGDHTIAETSLDGYSVGTW